MPRNHPPPPTDHDPEEESETESEEEEEHEATQNPAVSVNGDNKASNNDSDADPDEDDDQEGEEEEEEEGSEKTTTQVAAADGGGSDVDSDDSQRSLTASAFVVQPNSKKRPAEEKEAKTQDKKKAKKVHAVNTADGDAEKEEEVVVKKTPGGANPRLWKPEDEVKILKGMIDFRKDTGLDPNANIVQFYEFVKGNLITVADANKLKEKIRRLKDKYRGNAKKEADGDGPVAVKPHEHELYELSKKIWGAGVVVSGNGNANDVKSKMEKGSKSGGVTVAEVPSVLALPVPGPEDGKKEVKVSGGVGSVKRARKVKKMMELDEAEVEIDGKGKDGEDCDYMSFIPVKKDDFVVRQGLRLADRSKVKALNEKWKSYEYEAGLLFLKRSELVREQAKLILDAVKNS